MIHVVTLGSPGLTTSKNGFGAQCLSNNRFICCQKSVTTASIILISHGCTVLGAAFSGQWDKLILGTQTGRSNGGGFLARRSSSPSKLGTDSIELYQFHKKLNCPNLCRQHKSPLW